VDVKKDRGEEGNKIEVVWRVVNSPYAEGKERAGKIELRGEKRFW